MFSSFRNALDNLAQLPNETHPARRGSDPLLNSDGREPTSRASSLDSSRSPVSPLSSSQLAESALSNLRKSLASNRSGSPGPGGRAKPPAVATSASDTAIRPPKSRLEERLRASFTVGDVSRSSTPETSARSTPPLVADSPTEASASPRSETHPASLPLDGSTSSAGSAQPTTVTTTTQVEQPLEPLDASNSERHPEADIPLPRDLDDLTVPHDTPPTQAPAIPTSPLEEPLPEPPSSLPDSQPTDLTQPPASPSLGQLSHFNFPQAIDEQSVPSEPLPRSLEHAPGVDCSVDVTPPSVDIEPMNGLTTGSAEASSVESTSQFTSIHPAFNGPSESRSQSVEEIQKQLKMLEQRFVDVTESFKKLQAVKDAADKVVRDITPLAGLSDLGGFKDYLQNMMLKVEIAEDEIKRLNGKLTRQEDRIGELRDTHRLESHSQSDQIERLRKQAEETEALFKASQDTISQADASRIAQQMEMNNLKADLERSRVVAKEEEEKRVKAISLLKTVRQKLVKAEKEREDAQKELALVREKEKTGKEREEAERTRLLHDIEVINGERERAIAGLRAQFDKDIASMKNGYEIEISALRGQLELESATAKSAHSKELSAKDAQIAILEKSVNNLSCEKNDFFEQTQLRQAENESLRSHLESLQSQNAEFQYQLREANERLELLSESLDEARREQDTRTKTPSTSAEEVARLLSTTQSKYEAKLADLRKDLALAERERSDAEAEWSRKLREKTREADDMKRILASSARTTEESTETVNGLKDQIEQLRQEIHDYRRQIADLQHQSKVGTDLEENLKETISQLKGRISVLERGIEESKTREAQLKAANKTIREELRKVQSSAALLERQRNPGVGYWSRQDNAPADSRSSTSSLPETPSRTSSPAPSRGDEEVNLEYLRNVILQFLEHKEMRPNLVKVLSIILHFTPQETRRLIAKI